MNQRLGSLLILAVLALGAFYLYQKASLREPGPGELLLTGTVIRGPGKSCWILNANSGERFNFYGQSLGKLRTVGARVRMIVVPEPDKPAPCDQGRPVRVVEFVIDEIPDYRSKEKE